MDRQTLITPRPQLKGDVTGLIKPFTLQVWMMVLISAVSIMVIMVVLVKGEGYIIGYNPKMVVGQAAVWTLQTMTQETCPPYHNAQAYIRPHHHLHTHTYNQERTLQLRHCIRACVHVRDT
ncbi:hypothetical protein Pcinc_000827 [Petrolisthes cinctipes]|uniref:Uncharacterized protein n=1 Tax=Petrolisthes cinctipes TaxID=88211 RepID=A0AAE1GML3_PETCI|nr:hypothetical protein Pcinc_000827 [Petrolisthes cinctipes]